MILSLSRSLSLDHIGSNIIFSWGKYLFRKKTHIAIILMWKCDLILINWETFPLKSLQHLEHICRGSEILIICADVDLFCSWKGEQKPYFVYFWHIREPNMKEWFLKLPKQKIVERDIKYFQGQFCKTKEAHKSETWREESQPRRRRWEQQPSKVGGCQLTRSVCFEFRQLVANTCGR